MPETEPVKTKKKVLVVDDESDLRESIFDLLSPEFECYLAANGAEAFKLISENSFDVVLTDADMPELSGFELIRTLHERCVSTPIVMLTGRGSKELRKQTAAFNIFEYLEKPFNPSNLVKTLQNCCYVDWKATRTREDSNPLAKLYFEDFDIRISREAAVEIKKLADTNKISISSMIERLILNR